MSMGQEPGVSESRAFARAQVVQQLHARPDPDTPQLLALAVRACSRRPLTRVWCLAYTWLVPCLHMASALPIQGTLPAIWQQYGRSVLAQRRPRHGRTLNPKPCE